jgi:hypothetical protein
VLNGFGSVPAEFVLALAGAAEPMMRAPKPIAVLTSILAINRW